MMAGLKLAPLVAAVLAFAAVLVLRGGEDSPSDAAVQRVPAPTKTARVDLPATPVDPLALARVPDLPRPLARPRPRPRPRPAVAAPVVVAPAPTPAPAPAPAPAPVP